MSCRSAWCACLWTVGRSTNPQTLPKTESTTTADKVVLCVSSSPSFHCLTNRIITTNLVTTWQSFSDQLDLFWWCPQIFEGPDAFLCDRVRRLCEEFYIGEFHHCPHFCVLSIPQSPCAKAFSLNLVRKLLFCHHHQIEGYCVPL